ncbi:MAG: ribonuclease HII [Anaerotruncus sp.]|nr:ribonuclease HII [Anaerotruncus sp.]
MSERQREHAYSIIIDEALSFAVASATAEEIDILNIRQASLLAMRRAVSMLGTGASVVIVDGRDELGHNLYSRALVGGDGKSMAIAAASILAKVTRDEYMRRVDDEYPGYGFKKHKGYPTAQHYEAIRKLGPCREHRLSYSGVLKGDRP